MSSVVSGHYTYKEYSELEENAPYELINGELIMTPAPMPYHQKVSKLIEFELYKLEEKGLGEVYDAPIDVYFSETDTFQPDIIFIKKENLNIVGEKKINGAPDLVVEIISPGSAYFDLKQKKKIYEEFNVKEYWIVDPMEKSIEVFENKNNNFILFCRKIKKGKINSSLFKDFFLDIEKIF